MTKAETLRTMRSAWRTTIQRCHNPANAQYRYYGGRGITVCKRWRDSFENFVADMGLRPSGLTLERRKGDKGYSKSNCVWASRLVQSTNRRRTKLITWKGKTLSIAGWARELGIKRETLNARLLAGYTVAEAFQKPVKCGAKLPGRVYPPRKKPDMSNIPRGLAHPLTKLTQVQINRCRNRSINGESFSALAREYDVSVTTMSNACQGFGPYEGT